MSTFPNIPVNSSTILFEKSATYFTHTLAPLRIHALLPNVKLVVVLIEPGKRAYSWYQVSYYQVINYNANSYSLKHMKAHDDPIALSHNFTAVLRATESKDTLSKKLLSLKTHCLSPGKYYEHLLRWFKLFPSKQVWSNPF